MVFLASGTYVGNDQSSITITFSQLSRQPKIIFINGYETHGEYRKNGYIGIGINGYVIGINVYIDSDDLRNGSGYAGIYTITFSTSSITMTRIFSGDIYGRLNNSSVTYNYILLG